MTQSPEEDFCGVSQRPTCAGGIWIYSPRVTWARAIAVVLGIFTDRKVGILNSQNARGVSAEMRERAVMARPWPEDICILDLSSFDDPASQLLDIYYRLRNEAFWVGPCMVLAKDQECNMLRDTSIVPGGARFGDFPSIHRFRPEPVLLGHLLSDLADIRGSTLDPSEWLTIRETSPTLRGLSDGLDLLECGVRDGEAHDRVVPHARQLSVLSRSICCETEFRHGPVYDACCRIQAFARLQTVRPGDIAQFVEDLRMVLKARWRTSDGAAEDADFGGRG